MVELDELAGGFNVRAGYPKDAATGLSRRPFLGDWEKAMSVPRFGGKSGILCNTWKRNAVFDGTGLDGPLRPGTGRGTASFPGGTSDAFRAGAGEQQEDTDSHRIPRRPRRP